MKNQDFYQLSANEVLHELSTSAKGLTEKEATERLKIHGHNELKEVNRVPVIVKFFSNFKDLMIILLIVSGFVALYLNEYHTSIILFVIVLINALIGFAQEYKAEKIMKSLLKIVQPVAKVYRNGQLKEINSENLVVGDLVYIEAGDSVPADLRVLEEMELGTNDFSLTGESNPTRKFSRSIGGYCELGERNNLCFMGTTVATGNAKGIVIHTGMNTELGRIAHLSQQQENSLSPLQMEMNNIAQKLTIGTLILGTILTILALNLSFTTKEAFIFALGIASAMVPQGLPAQVSIALSLAAGRLAKNKAIVKQLASVETLGSTSIICTDKTGTLTKNEMTVEKVWINGNILFVTGLGYEPVGKFLNAQKKELKQKELANYKLFFQIGLMASNARISPPDEQHGSWYCIGDPTEGALITLAQKAGLNPESEEKHFPEIKEFSFDSVRKRMSSFRKIDGTEYVLVKGAPSSILEVSSQIWDGQKIRPLTKADLAKINQFNDNQSSQALRVLAFAFKKVKHAAQMTIEEAEQDLVFAGMITMIDPPRADVKDALSIASRAQIKVIIITGDNALTAEAIAQKIGLSKKKTSALYTGADIRQKSDIALSKILASNQHLIFARTAPEDKLRIVELLKLRGEVIAVTGDGINDAPALKKANIGVAMGKTGTDVAKQSAKIILTDDSFSTLVYAVKEGRVIFKNLSKTILSCITSNGGELFVVLLSLLFNALFDIPLAITAVQILAIDLIGEMFPLAALTWDPPQNSLMTEKPRNTHAHLLNSHTIKDLLISGFLMGAFGYANFYLFFVWHQLNPQGLATDTFMYQQASSLTYITIIFCQFANILSRRATTESVFSSYIISNPRLLSAFAISLFCIFNLLYNPWINIYFGTAPLQPIHWLLAIIAGFVYLLIREAYKKFFIPRPKLVLQK